MSNKQRKLQLTSRQTTHGVIRRTFYYQWCLFPEFNQFEMACFSCQAKLQIGLQYEAPEGKKEVEEGGEEEDEEAEEEEEAVKGEPGTKR